MRSIEICNMKRIDSTEKKEFKKEKSEKISKKREIEKKKQNPLGFNLTKILSVYFVSFDLIKNKDLIIQNKKISLSFFTFKSK